LRRHALTAYVFAAGMVLMLGALRYPWHNWDMIGYAGVALERAEPGAAALHRRVFDGLEQWASPGGLRSLTQADEFRRTVAADAVSLQELLPLYRNKPLYIATVRMMVTAGMDVYAALHLLSALCAALGLWLVAVGFQRMPAWGMLALPPVAALAGLATVARLATPDAMAFAGVALAALLMIRRSRALAFVLPLLPLVRPELVVFSLLVALWWAFRGGRARALAAGIVAGVVFVLLKQLGGAYGWERLFWFTFVDVSPYPARLEPDLTVTFYLRRVAIGVKLWLMQREFWVLVVCLGWLVWRCRRDPLWKTAGTMAALCALATALAVFLVFPLTEGRFIAAAATLLYAAALSRPATDTTP
jgi:hypothetical protein